MTQTTLPSVGFDRFIDLTWADQALELALVGKNDQALKAWLNERIAGKTTARKTANVLTNLWLRTYPETEHLHKKALQLAQQIPPASYLVLHWGMALANIPLFRDSVTAIGRLLRLQGSFQTKEIQSRMMEIYSNQGTVPRSVARVVQSLQNWGVLVSQPGGLHIAAPGHPIRDENLLAWLFAASLTPTAGWRCPLNDLLRLPELFPFEVTELGRSAVYNSPLLEVVREGSDREYVAVKGVSAI